MIRGADLADGKEAEIMVTADFLLHGGWIMA